MWLNLLQGRDLDSWRRGAAILCQRNILSAAVERNLRTTRKENDYTICTSPGAEGKVALQLNPERDIHVQLAKGNNCIQSAGFVYKTWTCSIGVEGTRGRSKDGPMQRTLYTNLPHLSVMLCHDASQGASQVHLSLGERNCERGSISQNPISWAHYSVTSIRIRWAQFASVLTKDRGSTVFHWLLARNLMNLMKKTHQLPFSSFTLFTLFIYFVKGPNLASILKKADGT